MIFKTNEKGQLAYEDMSGSVINNGKIELLANIIQSKRSNKNEHIALPQNLTFQNPVSTPSVCLTVLF